MRRMKSGWAAVGLAALVAACGGRPGSAIVAGDPGAAGSLDGTGSTARFDHPDGVTADGAGGLYVADTFNHTIRKVVIADGTVTTLAGAPGQAGSADGMGAAARFTKPVGVASDGAGNLYVADTFNQTIRKVVMDTGSVTTLAGTAGQQGSADGNAAAALFAFPQGVASDGAGNLYVADSGNQTIRKVVISTGAVSTLAGTAGLRGSADGAGAAASFDAPAAVVSDGGDTLYVADSGNNTIRRVIVSTGEVSTLAGTAGSQGSTDGAGDKAGFNHPQGLAIDGAGGLYVADTGNSIIRRVVIGSGMVSSVAGSAVVHLPAAVATSSPSTVILTNENAVLALHGGS
jgi:sugar lactone lactonase YvrE